MSKLDSLIDEIEKNLNEYDEKLEKKLLDAIEARIADEIVKSSIKGENSFLSAKEYWIKNFGEYSCEKIVNGLNKIFDRYCLTKKTKIHARLYGAYNDVIEFYWD